MTAPQARIVAALTLASGVAVLIAPRPLAVVGGLLLAFVLPGLALVGVLRRRVLTAVERTVLTPAFSMGVLIVAGLGIFVMGFPIDRTAWTVTTVAVTLGALLAARVAPRPAVTGAAVPEPEPAVREVGGQRVRLDTGDHTVRLPGSPMAEAHTVVMSIVPVTAEDEAQSAGAEQARRRRLLRQFLPLLVVAAVLGGASWLSFQTSRAVHDTTVTALSAAPSGPVDAAGTRTVEVFATGLLAADGPYTVRVTGPTGRTTLSRTVAVTGAARWYEALRLPGAQRLTVSLYRSGDTTAYRTLYISAVD